MKFSLHRLYLAALVLLPFISSGQIDDVGLWLGISAEKQVTRNASVSLGEQIRFNHDVTTIDVILTDAGFNYSFSKKFKAEFHYRFIKSNQENYYSTRHRFYLDLAYKQKVGLITLTLRERIQEQFNDYYSSENGEIPFWTLRSKLTAKFDLDKKYSPYLGGEVYYAIDNAKEVDQFFSRIRYEAGINYEFNRANSVNPFILLQHTRVVDYNELIYGITYSYSF